MGEQDQTRPLKWEAARSAVEGAVRKALELEVRICAAVVDVGGNPLAFLRMPGAPLHSVSISEDKAYTAVSFGMPTSRWHDELKTQSEAVRQGLPSRPRFVAFGGGLPICVAGEVIGGIGVSGASEEQDEACARAALGATGLLR
ncbi:GlcG/HbpS family heme-binding protein [Paraburkholderia aromaticivorans]|uniref:Cobalamin adenosyltransferase n=1 Tax=Paraburkholderia aromaticivorans TaxID=2026199 RepID=A0A248VYJ0_9BURK|nr:heme-binding protein [Paraburkholderia aromaticivorans]ASW03935.1 cobalamin adenosyltransferase [Paraburkholderia aromaticivorans]